ncbi:hypothetical protein PSQ20_16295 [Curvibacter sp. RS43]|uniref:Uncharacterized protein n=1 Tax=Curvibacter microcysteis TaxID=3026419 RepID=A0ABT5MJC3_9BURK|nr:MULTISPECIES: hypothetical protein [unclassified Curvibacter]MDD0811918.1 hypothetical protein [Curvibacter sp. RS43]MDD0816683.1 hypothetical protein [Curvibacter sp. HBC28]
MTPALATLWDSLLQHPQAERQQLRFGLACVRRVQHLLEAPAAVTAVTVLELYLADRIDRPTLTAAAHGLKKLALQLEQAPADGHAGPCPAATVAATHAVADAVLGHARQAAYHAAQAQSLASPESEARIQQVLNAEMDWQNRTLRQLMANSSPSRA